MKNSILVLIVLFSGICFGQYRDMIHLRNGSSVRGTIIERNGQIVKVKTKDGSILVFNQADVLNVETYEPSVSPSGYYLHGSVGLLGGASGGSFSVNLVQGYSFSQHWQLGGGFGFETAGFNSYVPAFLEGKFNLFNKPSSPYVKAMGGYMVPLNFRQTHGGFTFGAAVGYTYFICSKIGITTSMGYRFARLVEQALWWDDFETIRQLNRFELRFGLTFR